MITKQIACQLFAWGYKLVDKAGKTTYRISSVFNDCIFVSREDNPNGLIRVNFSEFGKLFFILARSTDKLCEEIEGKVPLVECAKIFSPYLNWRILEKKCESYNGEFYIFGSDFCYKDTSTEEVLVCTRQADIFNHLYSLHFAINLTEGTWKEI